jgi:hypothetical protein
MKRPVLNILRQEWIDKYDIHSFGFTQQTPVYLFFEIIFINISINTGVSWQKIIRINGNTPKLLAVRIICFILIDKSLRHYKELETKEIDILIGNDNSELVRWFYGNLF